MKTVELIQKVITELESVRDGPQTRGFPIERARQDGQIAALKWVIE